ncbi:Diphthamide biosynthesis protein 4 [Ophidiomyces ophidiicola]|uniref:Diphthamide biosynthesis protein 4 n=1 Tax=Ophidiomyces ophidiicola TaxID=1387563 RepID=UPI0020C3675D|nr:Diphthamide biosynthesis protein 4 [Ophidiomyces ophidiicola]KAI1945816.1 Diphthamide biosynthesis protein 4 [Ophidiomyces ophidiicola]KAI2055755.1 Diphthamide biosynthesis protein 4 [Ophidiomyces ophidiicola]
MFPTVEEDLPPPTTFYDILGLPHPPVTLHQPALKMAYRRALLKYHPDKSGSSVPPKISIPESFIPTKNSTATSQPPPLFSVDQITTAYKILSDPLAKAEYDRSLRVVSSGVGKGGNQSFRTGLEVFDLDDMQVGVEAGGAEFWYRGCRCGDEKGFLVREEDLESEMERGEILAGCRGCSLWAKILFAVDEGEEEEDCPAEDACRPEVDVNS